MYDGRLCELYAPTTDLDLHLSAGMFTVLWKTPTLTLGVLNGWECHAPFYLNSQGLRNVDG